MAWVEQADESIVRPPQDVDLAIRRADLDRVKAVPDIADAVSFKAYRVIGLKSLVRMKLTSYRRKDQVHLLDMFEAKLIDASWPGRFEPELARRLQALLDDPDG